MILGIGPKSENPLSITDVERWVGTCVQHVRNRHGIRCIEPGTIKPLWCGSRVFECGE